MRAINDYKILFYDVYNLVFFLIDNERKKQKRILKTYIVNMREYDLIFDYSWIYNVDWNIHWREQYWIYRNFFKKFIKKIDIALINVEQFTSLINIIIIRNENKAYIAISY